MSVAKDILCPRNERSRDSGCSSWEEDGDDFERARSLFSHARTSPGERPRGDSSEKQTYVQLAVALRKVDAVDGMSANDKES